MGKLVVLEIVGAFAQGFFVSGTIWHEGVTSSTTRYHLSPIAGERVKLPPDPKLLEYYRHWQALYRSLEPFLPTRTLRQLPGVTHGSDKTDAFLACRQAATVFEEQFNHWLNSPEFRPLTQLWLQYLNPSEEIRLLLQTANIWLKRFPWHCWHWFKKRFIKTEVSLSSPNFKQVTTLSPPKKEIYILVIMGDEIESQRDIQALQNLSDCQITWLEQPTREELNRPLWQQTWDILFFCGHSYSSQEDQSGAIKINQEDWLTITELRNHLNQAIERGLRLAIFNSCDGLGLAYQLGEGEGLYLPQVIVMREHLPVGVAPRFLQYFLEGFTQGKSLSGAVREARQQLSLLEKEFPCASWLPIICQNPTVAPPTWQQLSAHKQPLSLTELSWRVMGQSFAISWLIVLLILGLRWLGILEMMELQAFDHLLRHRRPYEPLDERILIVQATPEEIAREKHKTNYGASLSDQTLAQLLNKLSQYEPIAIGLDIYRDFPVSSEIPELASYLQQDHLFAICKVKAPQSGDFQGVAPPPEISGDRLGFSDVVLDSDRILRRHLLAMKPEDPTASCSVSNHLSWLVALYYLDKKEGVKWHYSVDQGLQIDTLTVGRKVRLPELTPYSGVYQRADTRGRQILLNYRSRPSPADIAQTVTVTDVLLDRIPTHKIEELKNRLILIGIVGHRATHHDYWLTPYSGNLSPANEAIPGVFIQAQMISQILSAVLDNRPLLRVWPLWAEIVCLSFWTWMGSLVPYLTHSPLPSTLLALLFLGGLLGFCYGLLQQGVWVPLVPCFLGLCLALWTTVFIRINDRKN